MSATRTTVATGLTKSEAAASRQKHGANVLTPPPRAPWWKQYLEKFDDPVIRVLMIAAGIAITVGILDGKAAEGVGILVAIFLATFLAFWNEYRANKEFDVLNKSNDDVAVKVLRDGSYTTVARRDVVVGDAVMVEVGEEVPADGRLVEAVSLLVNEARLTGESRPAEKSATAAATGETAYGPGQLLRGCVVVDGYGVYEVTSVGDGTEIGKTLRESTEDTEEKSPLNRQLADLSRVIGVVGFGVAAATFAALVVRGVWTGELVLTGGEWYVATAAAVAAAVALVRVWAPVTYDALELTGCEASPPEWLEREGAGPWLAAVAAGLAVFVAAVGVGTMAGWVHADPMTWLPPAAGRAFLRNFMIAVTIVVVAVPEGLAMSVTLSLAYSMRKMTASNNLVRRMDACETIGAATVICSDKTGTLTLNEMRVAAAEFAGGAGATMPDGPLRALVIEAVAANTTAHLNRESGKAVTPVGNPTEGALLLWLDANGADYRPPRAAFAIAERWTFTTERKFMATSGRSAATGDDVLHAKGAPEVLLARCTRVASTNGAGPLTAEGRAGIEKSLKDYQARGMRTLAFAHGPVPPAGGDAILGDMTWVGYVAIEDPVRPDVPTAVAACRRAGVRVKVVTGDSPETAREVARQIGLADGDGQQLSGAEFAALSDADARVAADRVQVLSRARPADKLRLVRMLKERGEVVAVTGDGVNDGPALNYADVGLAMGKTGTAVAKEASDIILLDDSFSSICTAILWGRSLYENIQRFILFQLTINVAALGIALLGPFIGFELPLTVMQMLWVNLIMDTFAALALATESPHPSALQRPPRSAAAFIITRPMAVNIFAVGGAFLAVLLAMIVGLRWNGCLGDTNEPSRSGTIFFTTFVLLQFWNLFNAKCFGRTESVFAGLTNNPSFLAVALAILIGQILLVQYGGSVFRAVPLSASDWLAILGATSVVLWVGEAIRFVRRRAIR